MRMRMRIEIRRARKQNETRERTRRKIREMTINSCYDRGVFDPTKKWILTCSRRPKTLVVRLYLVKRGVKQHE